MSCIIEKHLKNMETIFKDRGKYCEYGAAADLLILCTSRSWRTSSAKLPPDLRENECLVSIAALARRWRWGDVKVRSFLHGLELLHIIETKQSPGIGTFIRLLDPSELN